MTRPVDTARRLVREMDTARTMLRRAWHRGRPEPGTPEAVVRDGALHAYWRAVADLKHASPGAVEAALVE